MTEKLVNKNGLEGAEQLARHLNINLGRIVDRLTQCGADVIKFAGDAALCIFPVVEGGPDLAAQTLRATQLSLERISALEGAVTTIVNLVWVARGARAPAP